MESTIHSPGRRRLIATLTLLPLAACATPMGRYTVEQAVRRLLQLSSMRAFARLTEPGGFYDDQLTRINPPDLGGGKGGDVLSALLRTNAVRHRVAVALNDLAVDLADNAAPMVMAAVQRMTVADAVFVLRAGPTAATDLLARQARGSVVEALLPGATRALRSDLVKMASAALSASGGRDYAAVAETVSSQISDAIFRAIGREDAQIRRNPRATGDRALIALLG